MKPDTVETSKKERSEAGKSGEIGLCDRILRFAVTGLMKLIVRIFYRLDVSHLGNLPREGGVLLISNHVSYVDVVLLMTVSPRPIRVMGWDGLQKKWFMRRVFRVFNVIPVSSTRARDALKAAVESLRAGDVVLIFPEGRLTRDGFLQGFKKGFEIIARRANVPVVPVVLDSLWGSIFSYYGGRFFWKLPQRLPYAVNIRFGVPIPAQTVTMSEARETILDLGEKAFQEKPELKSHLAAACFRSLASRPGETVLVDRTAGRKELSAGKLLAVSLALSRKWKKSIPGRRVGLVFPPGMGGTMANLAVTLSGKTPVNLNFTAGPRAIGASMQRAGVETVISANAVRQKVPAFPWPEDTRDLVGELKALSKAAILACLAAIWVCPGGWLSRRMGIPQEGDREEAGLLFSSGSTGEPKGVVLSHRNIVGNCLQVAECHLLPSTETLLACLPIFHSFGYTVTLWYPLLHGMRVVTVPSPLECKRIAEAIHEEKATVLLGTPTFYRPYFKRVDKEKLSSLKYVVAGAEKTPAGFGRKWTEQFGSQYLEGYGLTETTPVISVNLPEHAMNRGRYEGMDGRREGSVGRMLPGIAARVVDPESGQPLPLLETGILQLRGPNVFTGYLNDPERTKEVFDHGWFVTGDLARFDEDGFLYIEGRISRFSKIGGEMVPHGTIENHIIAAFGLEESERPMVAVAGVADPRKGETLVLLSAIEITASALREKLGAAGLPNLWIPRIVKAVDEIPCLASGKLDLKGIERLAAES